MGKLYVVLLSVELAVSIFCGFAMASRGTIFTEKAKTAIAVVTIVLALSGILFSILDGKPARILLFILCYFVGSFIGSAVFRSMKIHENKEKE